MGTLVNGIKEIFATSQTTATHLPVCASDGTPQGRISVGDLASVLGVTKEYDTLITDNNFDLNTLITKIIAFVYNECTPVHSPIKGEYVIIVDTVNKGFGNRRIVQTIYSLTGKCYYRYSGDFGATWSNWNEITVDLPSFYKNYNSLASLSSALDVDFLKRGNAQSDLNQVRQHGLYYMVGIGNNTNIPSEAGFTSDSHGFMFVYGWSENRIIQIIVCGYGPGVGMWLRSADASYNFGSWGKIG